ncbi:Transferrin [Frankliniella fusca]|uniref:Transferrin n=1 Tax=Frankliniella fusca TaxID=407009 RepID=A0AAE1H460_9NEOP|nr:Transferrin [Frankliniella fusca]
MAPRPASLLLAALLVAAAHHAEAIKVYKACASERVPSYTCAGLTKGNTEVNCARVVDSADCVRQLVSKHVDFGVLSAEEILLASKYPRLNDETRVVSEIRHVERANEPFAFETVVVVKADYTGLLSGLKDKKFCHPGFSDSQIWTDRVLKHFHRSVVPQTCNKLVPRVEEEYDNLGSFFKAACIPGDWSRSSYRDEQIKRKHPELCALCDSPERCSYNSHRYGSHEAALSCLTNNGGEVAYVALQYVQNYFGLKDRKAQADPKEYRFLCPDGSMQMITASRPCTWIQQPWNAIVARKEIATEVQSKFKTWLPGMTLRAKDTWQDSLADLIFSERSKLQDPPASATVLSDYMARGRNDTLGPAPKEGDQCRPSVRWCVSGPLEAEKCDVLRQGAFTYGLEPSIKCVPASNMWECMAAVRNMTADILAIDAEYSHLARKTFGLNGLIYQDSNNERAYRVVAVVRAESGIKRLADLQKKSACFPEYGGLAWTAFVDATRSRKLLPRKCPSSAAMSDYLYRACAPGADDSLHNPNSDTKTRTAMCALCPDVSRDNADPNVTKCGTYNNSYFADKGAMRCLNDKRGDVAVVDLRALTEVDPTGLVKVLSDYRDDEYRVLCRNGSVSTQLGLLVDSKCALSTGIIGEIVTRDPEETIAKDAALLLLELEYWFGYGAKHYESALNIFGSYLGVDDVIFKKSAVGFVSIYDKENLLAQEFAGLMDRNAGCNLEGAGSAVSPAPALVLGLLLAAAAFTMFSRR